MSGNTLTKRLFYRALRYVTLPDYFKEAQQIITAYHAGVKAYPAGSTWMRKPEEQFIVTPPDLPAKYPGRRKLGS